MNASLHGYIASQGPTEPQGFILPGISPIAIFGSRSLVFGLRSHLCCQACLATAIAAAGAEVPAANCRGSQNQRLMFPLWVDVRLMHLFGTNKVFGLWFKKMEQKVFRKQFLKERAYRILEQTLVIKNCFCNTTCCSKLFLPPSLDLHSP